MSNNNSIDTAQEGFPPIIKHIYVGYYVIIFLLAVVGNVFAILTCYKNFKQSSAILLTYVASLALADLLFTLLTPADLSAFLAGSWTAGSVICRFQSFLIENSYTASVITLAAISHERLMAVSTPLLARSQRIFQRKLIPILIWLFSFIVCSPLLYAYTIVKDEMGIDQCVNIAWGDNGRQIYYTIQAILIFMFPLFYMAYAHFRIFRILKVHSIARERLASRQQETHSQRKIGKMLLIVTCIFVACYFPFVVIRSLKYFYILNHEMTWRLVQLMIFTQAAVNPVIYCFYNKQFRDVFKDLLKCRWSTIHHRSELSQQGTDLTKTRSSSLLTPCGTVRMNTIHGSNGHSSPVVTLNEHNERKGSVIVEQNEKVEEKNVTYV